MPSLPVEQGNGSWKRSPTDAFHCLPTPRQKIFSCNAQIPFLEGEASSLSSFNSEHVRVSKIDVKRIIENKHDNNEACCTCYKSIDELLRNRRFDGTARHMFPQNFVLHIDVESNEALYGHRAQDAWNSRLSGRNHFCSKINKLGRHELCNVCVETSHLL